MMHLIEGPGKPGSKGRTLCGRNKKRVPIQAARKNFRMCGKCWTAMVTATTPVTFH